MNKKKKKNVSKYVDRSKKYLSSMKKKNPFQWWKWVLFGGLILVIIGIVKNVFKNGFGALFAGGGGLNPNTSYGENSDQGGLFNYSNGVPTNTGGAIAGDPGNYTTSGGTGTKIPADIQKLVDEIYIHLSDWNLNVYPEIVNRIANLSKSNVWNCILYWRDKYQGATGMKLYEFLDDEWGDYYDPALAKIRSYGWQNK